MHTNAIGPIARSTCLALATSCLIAGCAQTSTLGRLPARSERANADRPADAPASRTDAADPDPDPDRQSDAERPVPADWVYPVGPRTKRMREYDTTADGFDFNNPGSPIGVVVRHISQPEGGGGPDAFAVRIERVSPRIESPHIRTTELLEAPDGSVSLAGVSSAKDEREGGDMRHFRYEPPLGLAPSTLERGDDFESAAEMIEYREGQPDSVVLKGDAERTFRALSRDEIEQLFGTGAPDLPGVLEVLEITIGPAKVDQRVARLVREGVGAVRELDERTVKVFGFTTDSHSILYILDEHTRGDTRD